MAEGLNSTTGCIGNDPGCPCQDGDACHYRDIPGSPGWPVQADPVAFILRRHPNGVTMAELIRGLTSPNCKVSQAQRICREALSDGRARVGWAGRLYAPKVTNNG